MIWHLVLLAAICAAAFFDAICDSIKDYRTHIALHPYRDVFHIAKHFSRLALLAVGLSIYHSWWADGLTMWLTLVGGSVFAKLGIWDLTYAQPWTWFRFDEMIKISTGVKFLDKILGLHH